MKEKSLDNQAKFLIAMSHPHTKIRIEQLNSYDATRYLELCKPFMDAVNNIKADILYPSRVDNVVSRFKKTKKPKKPMPALNIELFKSDKSNAELAKIFGVSINRIYQERQKIIKFKENNDLD
jgi:hypothetical protein